MYQLLAFGTGVTLAVMITINGHLTGQYGILAATLIIHIVGSVFAGLLCVAQKEKQPLTGHRPLWIYLGGAIGVLTTVFNNLAFGHISMTSIVALGLLGQAVTAVLIDHFGLFGMEKRAFQKSSLIGLVFSGIGIVYMMDDSVTAAAMAVIVSFATGITVVLSRTVNARLSDKIGALRGSFVNHVVGLLVTIVVVAVIFAGGGLELPGHFDTRPWIYIGGTLGVMVVLFFNIVVPKISAFRVTLLTFIGQVFMGILIDLFIGGSYSQESFIGGLIIAAGVGINMIVEQIAASRASVIK